VHRGKRQLRFGLDAGGAQNPQPGRLRGGIVKQCRLADAGFAAHHQRVAAPLAGGRQQPVDLRAFPLTAVQHSTIVWGYRCEDW